MRRPDSFLALTPVVAILALACRSDPDPVKADTINAFFPRIVVGPNVHVTPERADRFPTELGSCADPDDPNELAAAVMYDHGEDYPVKVGVWVSHDRGKTWSLAFDNPTYSIDPSCAFGPNGRLYALNMYHPSKYEDYGIVLHSSGDRGKSWTSTERPAEKGWWLDRPWIAVDNGNGSRRGALYFNAIHYRYTSDASSIDSETDIQRQLMFRSTDRGATLQEILIPDTEMPVDPGDHQARHYTGQLGVLSDGTIVSSIQGTHALRRVAISRDGGRSFQVLTVAGVDSRGKRRADVHVFGHTMPMLAVDESDGPFKDRVYIVWIDGATGRNQMWLTHSLDSAARRWAEPRVIDDTPAERLDSLRGGPHSTNPAIAVNKSGVVGISWADRRGLKAWGYRTRFIASLDGGETWSGSVEVADRPAPNRASARAWSTGNFTRAVGTRPLYMDFVPSAVHREPSQFWGMSADAGGAFHPMWIDDRSGTHQTYTAMVETVGAARKLEDVTEVLQVRLADTRFDSAGLRLSMDVRLLNASDRALTGPFLLKWIDPGERGSRTMAPRDGNLIALNADNGWAGQGAVWQIVSGQLGPGALSASRRFSFRLRDAKSASACCKDVVIFRVFVPALARSE